MLTRNIRTFSHNGEPAVTLRPITSEMFQPVGIVSTIKGQSSNWAAARMLQEKLSYQWQLQYALPPRSTNVQITDVTLALMHL
jgi:hypothetical protein